MLIEYKIKFENDGVTVTQRVEPPSDTGGGEGDRGDTGGGEGDKGDTGGGEGDKGESGGGEGDRGDTGGGGSGSGPVIVFGPIIFGECTGTDGDQITLKPPVSLQGTLSRARVQKTFLASAKGRQFVMEKQEKELWCWAAVAKSVDHHFSPRSRSKQCLIAREVLGFANCCNASIPGACNRVARLQDALSAVGRLERMFEGPLQFEIIRRETEARRPVCARIGWFRGGGHFVAISACRRSPSGVEMVEVRDPLFPASTMRYDDFVSAYQAARGGGKWTHTFLVQQ